MEPGPLVKRMEAVAPESVLIACQKADQSFAADLKPELKAVDVELGTLRGST